MVMSLVKVDEISDERWYTAEELKKLGLYREDLFNSKDALYRQNGGAKEVFGPCIKAVFYRECGREPGRIGSLIVYKVLGTEAYNAAKERGIFKDDKGFSFMSWDDLRFLTDCFGGPEATGREIPEQKADGPAPEPGPPARPEPEKKATKKRTRRKTRKTGPPAHVKDHPKAYEGRHIKCRGYKGTLCHDDKLGWYIEDNIKGACPLFYSNKKPIGEQRRDGRYIGAEDIWKHLVGKEVLSEDMDKGIMRYYKDINAFFIEEDEERGYGGIHLLDDGDEINVPGEGRFIVDFGKASKIEAV